MAKIPAQRVPSDGCMVTVGGEAYPVHEGEWVEILPIVEVGEIEAFAQLGSLQVQLQSAQGDPDQQAEVLRIMGETFDTITQGIASKVIDWNWTDLHGRPLPQPDGTPECLKRLSADELYWLFGVVRGTEDASDRGKGLRPLRTTSSASASTATPRPSASGRSRTKAS